MDSQPAQFAHASVDVSIDDDVSSLAWVQDELSKSLDAAHKSLRRTLKELEAAAGSDLDDVEPTQLRAARQQFHQSAGVLELVGLPAGASLLRGSEAAVQRFIAKPKLLDPAAVEVIERGSFALQDFLMRRLAGQSLSPVALFPQYRAVHELAGAAPVHPADLWPLDWEWRPIAAVGDAPPRGVDAPLKAEFESQVLASMRPGGQQALRRLSDLSAGLASQATGDLASESATLWQLAAGFFEAQALGVLQGDVYAKRIPSRLLAQLRQQLKGEAPAGERLARELLFLCAQSAQADASAAPRLAAVRRAYPAARQAEAVRYDHVQLGRFDPAQITQARKRVANAKDSWSAVAGGEMHRLSGLTEQFVLMSDSLKRLVPGGEVLGEALSHAAQGAVRSAAMPEPSLAMEVATSLLYIEAALEDGGFDHPEQTARVDRLAQRIDAVLAGATPEALEPWMEELYRRVSDRQTMGSVVQELRTALSESEKLIDQFFRTPDEPQVLIPVPAQLQTMRGVLSVLGLDKATQAVLRMRDDVDALVAAGSQARHEQALFERLAANLSALSFLIDLLGVQPQIVKSLFHFDAESGLLSSRMGRHSSPLESAAAPRLEPELVAQAQGLAAAVTHPEVPLAAVSGEIDRLAEEPSVVAQPDLAADLARARDAIERAEAAIDGSAEQTQAREQVGEVLQVFAATASDPVGMPAAAAAPAGPTAPVVTPIEVTGLEADDEMREVFLEEAREVVATARAALDDLKSSPSAIDLLTTVRRAFHTFKGSSRMVGLKEFGEAAWACEQLYNDQLARQRPASDDFLQVSEGLVDHLDAWVDAIAQGRDAPWRSAPVRAVADALRLEGRVLRLVTPEMPDALAAPATPVPVSFPPELDLPSASDLDLYAATLPVPLPESAEVTDAQTTTAGLDFEFDLDLDRPPVVEPLSAAQPLDDGVVVDISSLADLSAASSAPALLPTADTVIEVQPTDVLGWPEVDLPTPPAAEEDSIEDIVLDLSDIEGQRVVAEDGEPIDLLSDRGPIIESLQPSADLRAQIGPASALADAATSGDSVELDAAIAAAAASAAASHAASPAEWPPVVDESEESGTVPFEPNELIVALHPSGPGALHAPVEPLSPSNAAQADLVADVAPELPPSDQLKVIGSLQIGIPLFNIFLNEADELSRRLAVEISEWSHELDRPVGETAVALAHSLGGSSATVGFIELSALARRLEHALAQSQRLGSGTAEDAAMFIEASDEVRRLLHQFAAGFLKSPSEGLIDRLGNHEHAIEARIEAQSTTASPEPLPADVPDRPVAPASQAELPPEPPVVLTSVATGADTEAAADTDAVTPSTTDSAEDSRVPAADTDFADLGVAEFKPYVPPIVEPVRPVSALAFDSDQDIDSVDAVDPELFPIFEEEALELLPELTSHLRDWARQPSQTLHASACMRTLHTLKGGARLAGAMRLGELAHRLETAIEHLLAEHDEDSAPDAAGVEQLLVRADGLNSTFEALRQSDAQAYGERVSGFNHLGAPLEFAAVPAPELAPLPALSTAPIEALLPADPIAPTALVPGADIDLGDAPLAPAEPVSPSSSGAVPALSRIDWSRFHRDDATAPTPAVPAERAPLAAAAAVRVRTQLLDRMVNQAGEVSIARARLESEVGQIKGSLGDLTDNLERLRGQLRDIELQAETQMATRMEAAKAAAEAFDPLEFDRFTRFQELTRMMAESVNDVATVQRSLQRTLETAEDELAAQARLTRDLQDDLLRTRMVEFEGLSERLYRVVRQAAKETGKQVRLDIVGGSIEVDRGVLDRMTGAFEHLLRNCITHGIEPAAVRTAAGKDATGSIVVALHQEGNEVSVEFRDDGAGLNLARIREKATATGLLAPDAKPSEAELANLIFMPGFSTADTITELAGRGVGMDVVRSEVNALGGRIETASAPGQGTSFKLVLPLTTAVTQVVMLRCGDIRVAVPGTLIEIVRRATAAEVDVGYQTGVYTYGEHTLPLFWLGALLQSSGRSAEPTTRATPVVVVRSAQQRIALHVDEVLGNQEVVVKNLGPQLSSLPGLAGMTLLASGAVTLIYNPVALATVYGESARATMATARSARSAESQSPMSSTVPDLPAMPLVLVVDDSLTVRRVTQRLLVREGYRVAMAKDGLDALERLHEERPAVVLSDIEMPRMDGFDLLRNIRADAHLAALPVIMITSRIAQKHREYANVLGVNHYLGKPYSEEELLSLIGRYCNDQRQSQ